MGTRLPKPSGVGRVTPNHFRIMSSPLFVTTKTCVPAVECLQLFIAKWTKTFIAPLCLEVETIQAKRTKVHKLDGSFKMSTVSIWDSSKLGIQSVALVVTSEEGLLAFVPGLATNEGTMGFRKYYLEKLHAHR